MMRLISLDQHRWFYFEHPREGVLATSRMILFDGRQQGDFYIGTARTYTNQCPTTPIHYEVEGPVSDNKRKITLRGQHQVYNRCRPTGAWKSETLVFTYAFMC